MKKVIVFLSIFIVSAGMLFAANPFDKFTGELQGQIESIATARLNALAKDLGVLLGSGGSHNARALGFPGLDIGISANFVPTSSENVLVKDAGVDQLLFPTAQLEIGLPKNFDLVGRFFTYANSTFIGYGLRYGIFKSKLPISPALSVSAIYNTLNVNYDNNKFSATILSVDASASISLPVITPYISLGYTTTEITPDASITSSKGTDNATRIEGGINLSLLPLTYLKLGAAIVNGITGYNAGLGIRF